MATHDYVIANGTGAAVRSDLNNALAAIVSNNSGSSAPSTTYAYQWWADTNANVLKIRNSANNGWITLRELDGTMLIEDGAVGSPGLAFADDTDTGIFSPGANEIAFTTGGAKRVDINNSEVVINDPSNDVDFRVESDGNTHMLFVNAGTDRVGIGESSPNAVLHVTTADSGVNPNAAADELFIENNGNAGITIGSPAANNGRIAFGDPGDAQAGKILYDHSDNFLSFGTAGSETVRINNGGKVLVNTTAVLDSNAAAKLQVQADTGALLALGRDGTGVTAGDDLGKIAFYGNDAGSYQKCAQIKCEADGAHANDDKPSRLVFQVTADGNSSPTERVLINNAGHFNTFADAGSSGAVALLVSMNTGAGSSRNFFEGRHGATGVGGGTASIKILTQGDIQNTNNSYSALSDVKLKENIVDASSQWDDIKAVQVRNYNYKEETGHQTHRQLGVIAQEIETVSPGLVCETPDTETVQVPVLDENGEAALDANGEAKFTTEDRDLGTVTKAVNYSVLYMKAVKALQEAMDRIETLETKVAALEAG